MFPGKHCGLLKPSADAPSAQPQASLLAREDQKYEDVSEGNANPRARKDHLTQLLLLMHLHLVLCKGTSKSVQEQTLTQGWLDTVSLLAAAGKQSPVACTQPSKSMLQDSALPM